MKSYVAFYDFLATNLRRMPEWKKQVILLVSNEDFNLNLIYDTN